MSNIKYLLSFVLCLMSFNSIAEWASSLYEPMPTQILWRSDIDELESDFQAKLEPRYLDEQKKEFTYDLKIYGIRKGEKYLAYEEKDLGYRIYSLTTTAQGYSPLIIVSADDDKGEKVVRGYQYKNGKVTRGAFVRSLRTPEIALYPGESGLLVVYSKFNEQHSEKFYVAIFTDRTWKISNDERFAASYNKRFGSLAR
ncbi:MAG TPA: hypothetical protein DCS87_11415 [Rheinheimera sp.]|nr:hypothetical protein [Rheinheimera sp.]